MELVSYFGKVRNISGIYRIRNLSNNKFYIGSSANLYKRFIDHRTALDRGVHHSIYLQRAYNKYGSRQFIMEVLFLCKKDYLLYYEQQLINELQPSYNMNPLATSNRGYKWSKESREKARVAQLGNTNAVGHRLSESSKVAISMSRKGKCVGEENGFFGKTHSEDVKNRIKLAHLGKKLSESTKKKISESKKIKVKINDVIYASIQEAAVSLQIPKATLWRWVKNRKEGYEAYKK